MNRLPFLFTVLLTAATLQAVCNSTPVAVDDRVATFDVPVAIDVLANDSDAEGQLLNVAITGETCNGSVAVVRDRVVYTPSAPLTTPCTIDYQITDTENATASATITIDVLVAPVIIFEDGFESGDLSAWTQVQP